MERYPILTNLKSKRYAILASSSTTILFSVNYYLMSTFPGEANLACIPGATLTPANITFNLIISSLLGILIAGFAKLFFNKKAKNKTALTSTTSIGTLFATLTMFCTLCTFPALSIFGISIGLQAFTYYSTTFQIISLILIIISLSLVNSQLKGSCEICKLKSKQ